MSLYGLAVALAQQGDTAGALAQYEEAAELPGPFTLDARLAAAELSQVGGDAAKARTLYELAVSDAEDGGPAHADLRKVAQWHLADLATHEPESQPPSAK